MKALVPGPHLESQGTSSEIGLIPSALRKDLRISRQDFEGRPFVLIKDPVSLKYFRLPAQEYELACLFDGKRSIAQIQQEHQSQFPHIALAADWGETEQRIVRFAQELMFGGFLETTGASMRRRLEMQNLVKKPAGIMALGMRLLFLKIPLWDPDRALTWMVQRLGWVWSWPVFVGSLLLFAAGLTVFASNIGRIAPAMNDFFNLPNLLLLWILTIVVKVIHEFGHGLTCKRYGGEVHEMGFLLILFSPFLYANVTDSYLFPKKRHRILVAAAGIYVELMIASVSAILWAISQPGPTQQMLFNLMLVTSVWTVLFNANPLMKYDGYYMMCDLVDVPNLRAKAQICASNLFRNLFFGKRATSASLSAMMPSKGRGWFTLYSLAAQVYTLYVTYNIMRVFHYVLEPYGLGWLGGGLGLVILVSMVVLPLWKFFNDPLNTESQANGKLRMLLVSSGCVVLLAALAVCPWDLRIDRPTVVRSVSSRLVRGEVPGRLEHVYVHSGQTVKKDQILAVLSNPQISSEVKMAALLTERARRQVQLTIGLNEPAAYRQAQALLAQAQQTETEAKRQAAKLEIRAPVEGAIVSPDIERISSASLRVGDTLCEIAPLNSVELFIPLGERQARDIQRGQSVELRVHAYPLESFEGEVLWDTKTAPATELPPNLVATLGGDLAAAPGPDGRLVPLETTYGVLVHIPQQDGRLRPGMTGAVRIHAGSQSLGRLVWLRLLDFVSPDYRL